MTKYNVHILLVSAQAAPNLLAALDPGLKPDEVVLMVTGKMASRADALEKVFNEGGIKTSRILIADEHDFVALEAGMLDVAGDREGQSIALNLTGGTKLMALAAQSVASAAGWGMFYVDVDTDEVIWLGSKLARQKLSEHLRLSHYLAGYGFSLKHGIDRPQLDRRHEILQETLVREVGSLKEPISQLNGLGQQAESKHTLEVELSPEQLDSLGLDALLRKFQEAGVLSLKGPILSFTSQTELDFAKGGWLEQHVYRSVCRLTGELNIRDKAANLKVTNSNGVLNELDVVFMSKNRLFVIECKTARMSNMAVPKANDALYKLSDLCKRVGGLGTRGLFASYRDMQESEKKLATALNIELVCGSDLVRLDEKIKCWVHR